MSKEEDYPFYVFLPPDDSVPTIEVLNQWGNVHDPTSYIELVVVPHNHEACNNQTLLCADGTRCVWNFPEPPIECPNGLLCESYFCDGPINVKLFPIGQESRGELPICPACQEKVDVNLSAVRLAIGRHHWI